MPGRDGEKPGKPEWRNVMSLSEVYADPRPAFGARLDGYRLTDVDRHSGINAVIAQTSRHRVDAIRRLDIKSGIHGVLAIAHMFRKSPGHGTTEAHERADAYAACVHLDALDGYDVWCDGQHVSSDALGVGSVHISDMRHEWKADIRSPFHVVNFYIPQSVL